MKRKCINWSDITEKRNIGVNRGIHEFRLYIPLLSRLICTVVSIGAAGIPSAGLANVVIVLKAVGLPIDKIGPIFAVEWFM